MGTNLESSAEYRAGFHQACAMHVMHRRPRFPCLACHTTSRVWLGCSTERGSTRHVLVVVVAHNLAESKVGQTAFFEGGTRQQRENGYVFVLINLPPIQRQLDG